MDTSREEEPRANRASMHCSSARARAIWKFVQRIFAIRILGGLAAAAIAAAPSGAALACAGDCDGDGTVGIAEVITGVSIILGELPLSRCPALDGDGDGEVRIDELVAAVNAALTGCPATPTPSSTPTAPASPTAADTPSATATPTPTASPTASPTVPVVAGEWREAPLAVTDSTCPALLTETFSDDLAGRPPCDQTVESLSELAIALTDCTGTRIEGTLDRDGTIHVVYPTTEDTVGQCTVALTASAAIPAAMNPTVATYTFALVFTGTCPVDNCAIEAQGSWTRL